MNVYVEVNKNITQDLNRFNVDNSVAEVERYCEIRDVQLIKNTYRGVVGELYLYKSPGKKEFTQIKFKGGQWVNDFN